MDYDEEQNNELEALSEIYFDEIKVLSNRSPISFSIKVVPQNDGYTASQSMPADDCSDEDEDESDVDEDISDSIPSIEFLFTLPAKYPDEKPSIKSLQCSNLEEDEIQKLLEILDKEADSLLGTVMIFNLVSKALEWLTNKEDQDNCDDDDQDEREEEERIARERQAEENRKIEGTPVTKQSFLLWKAKFDAEMLKLRLERQKKISDPTSSTATKRLTGRELFETDKSMIESDLNFVEDLDQGEIEALMQNVEGLDMDDDEDDDAELTETDLEDQDSEFSLSEEEDDDELDD